LARYRGEQFLRVGQSLLENSAGFSLGSNCRIVLARSFDALDVICFRWHCWLLDVIALTKVDEGGPMFAGADEVGMQLLHFQIMQFDTAGAETLTILPTLAGKTRVRRFDPRRRTITGNWG